MCGITGIFYRDNSRVNPNALAKMTNTLAHRGPDNTGIWYEKNIGLGHRRLSIRDLTTAGNQPMADPYGHVIVTFNGEIYNYQELKNQLENESGFNFKTQSDTEILTLGYLAWGENLFNKIEGMFAIGIWDKKSQKLILSRDAIGIKPLYVYEDKGKVLFASELKAFIDLIEIKLNTDSLHTFLAAGYTGPSASLLRNVRQIRPGSFETFTVNDKVEHCFWKPTRKNEIISLDEAIEEFEIILHAVVKDHMLSDVPVCNFQSGGIDSTLISLALSKQGISVPLLTASFSEKSHDESDAAAEVSQKTGLKQYLLHVEDDNNPELTFKKIVYHFDGQCSDTGSYAFYRLCGEAKKYSKVVLSGDGGDEFFGGYDTYLASQLASKISPFIPISISRALGKMAYHTSAENLTRLPISTVFSRFFLGLGYGGKDAHVHWRRLVPAFLQPGLYGSEMKSFIDQSPYSEYEGYLKENRGNLMDQWLIADQKFHLQSVLTKVDAMSMAHSIEVRVPLLDRRIMDFAGRCSNKLFVPKGGPRKMLLRRSAELMGAPDCILASGKKGFNMPISKLLRNELKALSTHWLDKNPDILSPYLNPDHIRILWNEHASEKQNHAYALWPILSLAVWLDSIN